MFNVGDKVVYPMHGAGIIEKIETKKILDTVRDYYVLKISCGEMKVMIPVDNSEGIGVRNIESTECISSVMKKLGESPDKMPTNWNRRYRENTAKLKSGDIFSVAGVVRNLMVLDREKGLSTGERKMLINARQILLSEIVLVKDIGIKTAEKQVEEAVFGIAAEG